MKRCLLFLLGLLLIPAAQAVEILHWQRLPLSVPLIVGQERIVFVACTRRCARWNPSPASCALP